MTSQEISPFLRRAYLAGGLALCLLLVASAAWLGATALRFGIDAIGVLSEFGIRTGIELLSQDLADLIVLNGGERLGGDPASGLALLVGVLGLTMFVVIYPAIWLMFARIGLGWIGSGIWAFQKPLEPEDIPIEFDNPEGVRDKLAARKLPRQDVTPLERSLLGQNAGYVPRSYRALTLRLKSPFMRFAERLGAFLGYALLTLAVLFVLYMLVGDQLRFPLPSFAEILANLVPRNAVQTLGWALAALVVAGMIAALDWFFLRALIPPVAPTGKTRTDDQARDLTANKAVIQLRANLLGAIQSASDASGRDPVFRTLPMGFTATTDRDRFGANEFEMDLLIEGTSARPPSYAARAIAIRIIGAIGLVIAGALVLLFNLAPGPIVDLLSGQAIPAETLMPVVLHLVMATALGLQLVSGGRTMLRDGVAAEQVAWFATPVVHARLNGTINTQTALSGKGLNDSVGAEMQLQQVMFDLTLHSTTLLCDAPTPEGQRDIWSFAPDAASQELSDLIRFVVCREGGKSLLDAAARTIEHNEQILAVTTELRHNPQRLDGPPAQDVRALPQQEPED